MIGTSGTRLNAIIGIGSVIVGALGIAACVGGSDSSASAPAPAASAAPSASATETGTSAPVPPPPPVTDAGAPPPSQADAAPPQEDAAPPPPTPVPQTLGARLVLWLRADQGVQGPVDGITGWKDQSTYANDAVTQGASPIKATTSAINGHPTVHFDGSSSYLAVADSPSLQLGTDDVSAFAVVAHASPLSSASRMIFSKQGAAYPYVGFGMYMNYANTYGIGALLQYGGPDAKIDSATPDPYATSKPYVVWAQRSAGDSIVVHAGAAQASANALKNGAAVDLSNSAALRIGGQGGSGQALTGDLAELVLVKGAMTSTETESMVDYLTSKYGL